MENLLILHGWGSNSQRWSRVKEILERQKIQVFIPDLPGFGQTPPPKEVWGKKEYLNWILNEIQKKGWEKFNLLGHSFGGELAMFLSATCPQKVKKLILLSPAILRKKPASKKVKFAYFLARVSKKIFNLPILKNFKPIFQKIFYRIFGGYDYYLAKGVMKEVMKKILKEDLSFLLKKIQAKTLILWAKDDPVLPASDALLLNKKIKNSKVKIFPKGGHSPHRNIPEDLSKSILEFIYE
jgi:pimeloyl-ACP methyl ester carboxylesterase